MSQELLQRVRETDIVTLQKELEDLDLDPETIKKLKDKAFEYMNDSDDFCFVLSRRDYNNAEGEQKIRLCYYFYFSSKITQ